MRMINTYRSWLLAAAAGALVAPHTANAERNITFGPRVSYMFDNFLQTTSNEFSGEELLEDAADLNFSAFASEAPQAEFTLFGGAIAFPSGLKDTDVVLTFQQGEADVETRQLQGTSTLTPDEFGILDSFVNVGELIRSDDLERTDVEVSLRRVFSTGDRLTISGLAGVRYERTEIDSTFEGVGSGVSSILPPFETELIDDSATIVASAVTGTAQATREYYSIRAGAGVYAPVNDAHGFYLDAQAMLAYFDADDLSVELTSTIFTIPDLGINGTQTTTSADVDTDESVFFGPDITTGYRWNITDRVGFDARYRAQIFYDVDGETRGVTQDPRISHGVNMGLSFTF